MSHNLTTAAIAHWQYKSPFLPDLLILENRKSFNNRGWSQYKFCFPYFLLKLLSDVQGFILCLVQNSAAPASEFWVQSQNLEKKKKRKKKAKTQFFCSHAHNPLYKCLSEAECNVTAYITSTYCSPPRLNCHVFISFVLESAWFEQPEVGSYIQKVESPWHSIVFRWLSNTAT